MKEEVKIEVDKEVKAERKRKKRLEAKVASSLDNSKDDILKWDKEGREIYFKDSKEEFIKLNEATKKKLSPENRMRYGLAERIFNGEDVIGAVQDGQRGWEKDYNVRPGSYTDNLAVFGKKKGYSYVWSTPKRISEKKRRGWKVETDPNVKTLYEDSSTYKTVGGEKKPELILMSRPKAISDKERKSKVEKRDKLLSSAKETFVKSANDAGFEAIVDE